jgi:hypothetical protein
MNDVSMLSMLIYKEGLIYIIYKTVGYVLYERVLIGRFFFCVNPPVFGGKGDENEFI